MSAVRVEAERFDTESSAARAGTADVVDIRHHFDGITGFFAGMANVVMQGAGAPGMAYGMMESKEPGRLEQAPVRRLRTTLTYLAVVLLGSDDDRAAYAEYVNKAHRPIHSTKASPVKYNAFSPDLQLWVAACLAYGLFDGYEALHGQMDADVADAFYRESIKLGTTLQMRPESWPADRLEFDAFFERRIESAEMDASTRAYFRSLIKTEFAPRYLALPARFLGFMNTGFLPAHLRDQMELEWTYRDQRIWEAVNKGSGLVYGHLPHVARNFPFNVLLWDVRRKMKAGRPLI